MTNKWPATCPYCARLVEAGKGWLVPGRPGDKARVIHPTCIPVYEGSSPCK